MTELYPAFNKHRDVSQISRAESLLQVLESDDQSIEYRQPVDYIGLGLIDYPSIVKQPMDLSTVKVVGVHLFG